MFGWDDGIALGLLAGSFIYHRWIDPPTPPPPPPPAKSLSIPRTDAGAAYPIIYGRTRVRASALAYASTPKAILGSALSPAPNATYVYGADLLMVIGIPFAGGANTVRQMWAGELLLAQGPPGLSGQTGHGGTGGTDTCQIGTPAGLDGNTGPISGLAEVLDGRATQQLVDGSGTPLTFAGKRMVQAGIATTNIVSYRNYLSVFLCGGDFTNASGYRWWVGSSPQIDAYSFEVQSLPASWLGPNQQVAARNGDITAQNGDANPIDVLYDILTGTKGKLGLPTSRIDSASFIAAAATLDAEGNGFSRAWDQGQSASEMIAELMRQIDGVIYPDPLTGGTIKVKLVRNDYTVSALLQINPDNCADLQQFAAGGWTAITNKIDSTFKNRGDAYRDGPSTAQNQANAVGQSGETFDVQLQFPGVCEQSTADNISNRELFARSRPLMKCSALVNQTFYQVNPGDCVRVKWPEWGLSDVVFRVAAVSRGTPSNPTIRLDLIQDYFYTWRGFVGTIPGNVYVKPTTGNIH